MRESKFTAKAPRTPRNAKEISLVAAELLGVKSSTPFCGRRALELDIPQAISRNSVYRNYRRSTRLTKGPSMRNLHLLLSLSMLLCLSVLAYPQSDRGVLTGTVTDSSGAVIPGASVIATNAATNVSASTVTTEGGLYAIPALQPGTYKVRVELAGFKAYEQSQVVIAAATTVRVDAKLEIGRASC